MASCTLKASSIMTLPTGHLRREHANRTCRHSTVPADPEPPPECTPDKHFNPCVPPGRGEYSFVHQPDTAREGRSDFVSPSELHKYLAELIRDGAGGIAALAVGLALGGLVVYRLVRARGKAALERLRV